MAECTEYTGWGRAAWSDGSWGNDWTRVCVTGVSATVSLGEESIAASAAVEVTGVSANAVVGDEAVTAAANVYPTGVVADTVLGTSSVIGEANVYPTGVVGDIVLGSVEVIAGAYVDVTGVSATGSLGSEAVTGDANVYPTGLVADALLGGVLIFGAYDGAAISTDQYKIGDSSLYLGDSNGYVVSGDTYNFGGDPFTLEFWARPDSVSQDAYLFDSRDSTSNETIALRQVGDKLYVIRGNTLLFEVSNVFTSPEIWKYITVTRGGPSGDVYYLYIDGVLQDFTTSPGTASAANLYIGQQFNNTSPYTGYIDQFRISTVDRYDGSSFTPPTTAFTTDIYSPVLLNFSGANGSTAITNSGQTEFLSFIGDATVSTTGVSGSVTLGSEAISGGGTVYESGLVGSTLLGSVTATGGTYVYVSGVRAVACVNSVFLWSDVVDAQDPNWVVITSSRGGIPGCPVPNP